MNKKEPYIGMPIILGEYDKPSADSRPAVHKPENKKKPHAAAGIVVGMAYVPWQEWKKPYDIEKAFAAGTIFPDLNLPLKGIQGGTGR